MYWEILTVDDVIKKIAEVLGGADGQFIEKIANQLLSDEVEYVEDSIFRRKVD